ncbi:hypothetical protein C8_409 [Cannes 8 virus]|nr:hypothetical protein C8_409 [Cannes 8 virus]
MSKQEVVYLVRDDRLWDEGIYKVGRSSNWEQRQKSYGGARVLRVENVSNSANTEKKLISKFRENFAIAKGAEYFFCGEKKACKIFDEICAGGTRNDSENDSPQEIRTVGEFRDKFIDRLSRCKKKTVLKGVLPLLAELKRKNEGLWEFDKGSVVFLGKRETIEDKGEFFKCFNEVIDRCKDVCVFEIHNEASICGKIKETVRVSGEYYSLKYEVFWRYLKKKEFFS